MLASNCCRLNAPQCLSQAFSLRAPCAKESSIKFQLGWGNSGLLGRAVCAKSVTRVAMPGMSRLAPLEESARRRQVLEVGRRKSIKVGAAVGAAGTAEKKVKARRGPRLKIIRRLGPLPGLSRKISKKSTSGRSTSSRAGARPKKKPTQYGIRLMEKQKLLFNYGLKEGQLLRLVKIARRAKGSTGQVLLQLLEMRLDNVVYRLGFAPTIPAARQLVSHGHITVNGRRVNIASYRCKPQETIAVREKEASKKLVTENVGAGTRRAKPPSHLNVSSNGLSGTIKQVISRQAVGLKVNELLVVEYYSRMA